MSPGKLGTSLCVIERLWHDAIRVKCLQMTMRQELIRRGVQAGEGDGH